jgi:hypothetical protein
MLLVMTDSPTVALLQAQAAEAEKQGRHLLNIAVLFVKGKNTRKRLPKEMSCWLKRAA